MKISQLLALFGTAAVAASGASAADSALPKDYPLQACPVSGEQYGSGGMVAYKVTHENTDVWLCCKGCLKKFNKEPAKFAQVVKDAAGKK